MTAFPHTQLAVTFETISDFSFTLKTYVTTENEHTIKPTTVWNERRVKPYLKEETNEMQA
jgi:hypothetical protein